MTVQEFEAKLNATLAKENKVLGAGVAKKLYDEMKQKVKTDALVDRMLKSLGQSLEGNEKLKDEKVRTLITGNIALDHLRKCQREIEGVA